MAGGPPANTASTLAVAVNVRVRDIGPRQHARSRAGSPGSGEPGESLSLR